MFDKILDKIKPTKGEFNEIKKLVNSVLKEIKIKDAKPVVGGSFAKDTWLSGIHDIDIFVKFNYKKYKDRSKKIDGLLYKGIKKLKPKRLHGSRDYFQIKKGKLTFEIVPILDIRKASQAVNITDVSPLHALWVKKHKLHNDIRLSKAFARAHHVYGAETHIRGFSGYVLEILTIYYGGFMKFVRGVSKWKGKTVIDPEKLLKKPLKELNTSKISSPLVLVDPVDKARNAAAVVSKEKYDTLIKAAKLFLKNPSERYFLLKEEKIPKNAIAIEIKPKKGKSDVVAGKLFALFNKIKRQIKLEGFGLKKSGFIFDGKAVFWFVFKSNKLSEYKEIRGPPLKLKKHVEQFRKKHKKTVVKKGFVCTKESRKFTDAEKFVKLLYRKLYK
ncbi:MAG: CCA tRNA nucleotidyltransferase [Candidatus Woesearchaeota archaeon]